MNTTPTCTCPSCVDCCKLISGVMSPREALAAIAAGYAHRLMLVMYWEGDVQPTPHLQPLTQPSTAAGHYPPAVRVDAARAAGRCTFLTPDGLCEIHDTPFKPIECRNAFGKDCPTKGDSPPCPEYRGKAGLWGTPEATTTIATWRRATETNPSETNPSERDK